MATCNADIHRMVYVETHIRFIYFIKLSYKEVCGLVDAGSMRVIHSHLYK